MAKNRKPIESVKSTYTALPHTVLDCAAFVHAGHTARSLLFELLRQHNGRNNGHLQLASPWLKRRGWKSSDTFARAKKELVERELILQTRQGGLNAGPSLFALTWLPISNFVGLDIFAREYQPGAWRFLDPSPLVQKRGEHTATRNSPAPSNGTVCTHAAPPHGAKMASLGNATAPPNGNNECYQLPVSQTHRRIVGAPGRSGKRATGGST